MTPSWQGIPALGPLLLATVLALLAAHADTKAPTGADDVFIFAGSANYRPHQWLDPSGRPRGFIIDLQRAIGRSGGRAVRHELTSWPEALAALDTGRADALPMFASRQRAERYTLTDPFYYLTHAVFGPEGYSGVVGPEALDDVRIAVVRGGYAEAKLAQDHPNLTLVQTNKIKAALLMVTTDDADFALVAQPIGARLTATLDFDVKQISRPIWPRAYVFAVRKDRPETFAWLQEHLRRIQAAGRYHAIYSRWQDELEWDNGGWEALIRPLGYALALTLVILTAGLIWNRALQRRVALKTTQLESELNRRRHAEAGLRELATHDSLTGLPNRTEFAAQVQSHLDAHRSAAPLGVLTINLLDLAELVSGFGHATGEAVIKRFAERLRRLDVSAVGSFGRGHFGILTEDPQGMAALLDTLDKPLAVSDLEVDPHVAVGAAWIGQTAVDAEELIRRAETALASGTARRRTWTEYQPSLEPNPEDLLIVRDFRRHAAPGMTAVFQPQYDLRSDEIVGAEALFRWEHPKLGPVPPARLIPLLERTALIEHVTDYMMEAAVELARTFRAAEHSIRISLNISASELLEGNLQQRLLSRMAPLGHGAGGIAVEVTETSLIQDPSGAAAQFAVLREAGVECALDDFGTGFSSLSFLSRFPLDEIKIDKVFVADMHVNPRHRAIVRSSIALAHDLGLRVVAEGAENEITLQALRDAGCDSVQGYVRARPMPAEQLISLLGNASNVL